MNRTRFVLITPILLLSLNCFAQIKEYLPKPQEHVRPQLIAPLTIDSTIRIIENSSLLNSALPHARVREISDIPRGNRPLIRFAYAYPIKFGHRVGSGQALLRARNEEWILEQMKLDPGLKEQTDAEKRAEAEDEQTREKERLIRLYPQSRASTRFAGSFKLLQREANGRSTGIILELTDTDLTIRYEGGPKSLSIWYGDIMSMSGNYLMPEDGPNLEIIWNSGNGPATTIFEKKNDLEYLNQATEMLRNTYQAWMARYRDVRGKTFPVEMKTDPSQTGMPVPVSQKEKDKSLFLAVLTEDVRTALALISAGANVNLRKQFFPWGETGIHDKDNYTLLYWACLTRQTEVIRALLERGADPNLSMELRPSPLAVAVESGDLQVLDMLIYAGGDVNWTAPSSRRTALMAAAHMGNPILVKRLIESGAKLNKKDSAGDTALHYAQKRMKEAELSGQDPVNFVEILEVLQSTGSKN